MFREVSELVTEYDETSVHYQDYLSRTQKAFNVVRDNKVDTLNVETDDSSISTMYQIQLILACTNNRNNIMRAERNINKIIREIREQAVSILIDPIDDTEKFTFPDATAITHYREDGIWR